MPSLTPLITGCLRVLPPAAAAAGVILLGLGLWADLARHGHDDTAILAQLPPQVAPIVREHQAREAANPWHRTLVLGQGFLVAGLASLYLTERLRRPQVAVSSGAP